MNIDIENSVKLFLACMSVGGFFFCGISQLRAVELVAHRGASKDAPENTLVSLKLGWQQTDADELDIHVTKDGQIVVMHDLTTKRTTGTDRKVAESTLAELRLLDAGSWKGAQWAGEKIPTLAEVLAIQPEKKRLFIEIKCGDEILPELERVLRAAKKQPDQVVLIGFKIDVMKKARKLFPDLTLLLLASVDKNDPKLPKVEDLVAKAKQAGLDGLDLEGKFPIDKEFVKAVTDAKLQLYVWTVDDPVVARRLVEAGVRGITTNCPDVLGRQLGL